MKWSWKLARVLGVDVYVHATFLLILAWVAYSYWIQAGRMAAVVGGIFFMLALFACVVLHEYGHALMARRYGIQTRDITLYPIGGVARLERIPEKPIEELWVALAGPAVNIVIASLLGIYLLANSGFSPSSLWNVASGGLLSRMLVVNLTLAVFNLIPAFPMDGGRVLRALLAMRIGHLRATRIAASVGQALAILFVLAGISGNTGLIFIAFFVWIGAEQEASMARVRFALGGVPVSRAMETKFDVLSPRDTLTQAVELILAGAQHDFPVVEQGRLVGMLDQETLIRALKAGGRQQLVSSTMRQDLLPIESHEMIEQALARLESSKSRTLPVTNAGQLAGLLTQESITQLLRIRSAIRAAPGTA
jgi:Zn-dependent protease/CBS domain-containing protein